MSFIRALLAEVDHEAAVTRRLLERLPDESFDFAPHPRSMTLGRLAAHIAQIPFWGAETLRCDELLLDPAEARAADPADRSDVLGRFDSHLADFRQLLATAGEEAMGVRWRLRTQERIVIDLPRAAVLRGFVLSHLIHHRGQLTVYLRLLDVPLPPIYGPTADER